MSAHTHPRNTTAGRTDNTRGLRGLRVALVLSPSAGHAIAPDELRATLQARGVTVASTLLVTDLDPARPRGPQWLREGIGGVIAAGGDGTVSGTVTQVAGTNLPIGILPLGTMNDVARSLHLPLDLDSAASVLAEGHLARLDIGEARTGRGPHGTARGTSAYFVQALTLGLHERYAERAAERETRETWGPLAAPVAAAEALAEVKPFAYSLLLREVGRPFRAQRWALQGQAVQITIANTPRVGGPTGLAIAHSSPEDALLDIVLLEDPGDIDLGERAADLRDALGELKDGLFGRQGENDALIRLDGTIPGIRHFQARSLVLTTERPMPTALDGEPGAATPLEACVAPGAVSVVMPPGVPGTAQATSTESREQA